MTSYQTIHRPCAAELTGKGLDAGPHTIACDLFPASTAASRPQQEPGCTGYVPNTGATEPAPLKKPVSSSPRSAASSAPNGQTTQDKLNRLSVEDFVVVTPYNDQRVLIEELINSEADTRGLHVATVDKFQGQEKAVVFFSMAASAGEDVPRGTFLFSRNRLNIAISRAECLAYLVCTQELLNTRARDVEHMRLISTLNAFVEYGQRQAKPPAFR